MIDEFPTETRIGQADLETVASPARLQRPCRVSHESLETTSSYWRSRLDEVEKHRGPWVYGKHYYEPDTAKMNWRLKLRSACIQRVIIWRHHTYGWILCRGERPSVGQYEMFVMSQYGAMLIRTIGKNTVFFLICFYERWFQDRGKCTLFIYLAFYIVYPCD
jgi:hypothetical protein